MIKTKSFTRRFHCTLQFWFKVNVVALCNNSAYHAVNRQIHCFNNKNKLLFLPIHEIFSFKICLLNLYCDWIEIHCLFCWVKIFCRRKTDLNHWDIVFSCFFFSFQDMYTYHKCSNGAQLVFKQLCNG